MAFNKISLSIAGLNILVNTQEDEDVVLEIAQEISSDINDILSSNPTASVTNSVLLCAIEYLNSFKKANRTANNMRNQIKEYLAEAANAKLQYDDESKRCGELEAEIHSLRGHLSRLATEGDNSGVVERLRRDISAATSECERLRKINLELSAQIKSVSDKSEAMNSYISEQDKKLSKLAAIAENQSKGISEKDATIDELTKKASRFESLALERGHEIERVSTEKQTEIERLKTELSTLERMIDEDRHQQSCREPSSAGRAPVEPVFFAPEPSTESVQATEAETRSAHGAQQADVHKRASFDIDIDPPKSTPIRSDEPGSSFPAEDFADFEIEKDDVSLGFRKSKPTALSPDIIEFDIDDLDDDDEDEDSQVIFEESSRSSRDETAEFVGNGRASDDEGLPDLSWIKDIK